MVVVVPGAGGGAGDGGDRAGGLGIGLRCDGGGIETENTCPEDLQHSHSTVQERRQ